ncbi:MAG TPA: PilW family protein [Steroidobacteraceae bacterium]|nr:PilW family protein [Steroidobacteraceae bacterium]
MSGVSRGRRACSGTCTRGCTSSRSHRHPRLHPRHGGFSLVEMMIAIVLGLLVSIALVSMFVGVRSASRMTSGVGALSDSGRFALDSIEESVRGAGNFACNSTAPVAVAGTAVARQLSLLTPGASPLVTDFGEPLSGYEAKNTGPGQAITVSAAPGVDANVDDWTTTPALGSALDAVLVSPPVPQGAAAPVGSLVGGSDILVIHETEPATAPAYATQDTAGTSAFTVNSSSVFSANGGQLGVISNCVQMEVFQVQTFNPGAGSGVISLTGGMATPGNSAGSLPTDPDFTIGAEVEPADSIVYYIGVGADGDGALFKYETNGGVFGVNDGYSVNEELVPDVENMQILYGVETSLSQVTQTVAQYVTADQVANYSQTGDFNGVISVKIALLVASPPTAVQPTAVAAASAATCSPPVVGELPCLEQTTWQMAAPDSRLRKVYEQTMYLRDMSP